MQPSTATTQPLIQPRGLFEILKTAWWLYTRYFPVFLSSIMTPWLLLVFGAGLWLALPLLAVWLLFDVTHTDSQVLIWLIFIASNAPGFILFVRAFWRFMVELAAQNFLVQELLQTGFVMDAQAPAMRVSSRRADYAVLLSILIVLQAIPVIVFLAGIVLLVLPASAGVPDPQALTPENMPPELLASGLFVVVGGLLTALTGLALSWGFCLTYQVFAFEPNLPLAVLGRAVTLVLKKPLQALALVLFHLIVLEIIAPSVVDGVFAMLGVTSYLAVHLQQAVSFYFEVASLQSDVTAFLASSSLGLDYAAFCLEIASFLLSQVLMLTVAVALLPFSTACFALLYGEAVASKK